MLSVFLEFSSLLYIPDSRWTSLLHFSSLWTVTFYGSLTAFVLLWSNTSSAGDRHGSKTFHGSPRALTSVFLCKGIALCFILDFPILNLPVSAIFQEKSHHGWHGLYLLLPSMLQSRNSCLIKPCCFRGIPGVQQHDSRGLRKASIWVLRCFFLMQNTLFCICLGGSLVI